MIVVPGIVSRIAEGLVSATDSYQGMAAQAAEKLFSRRFCVMHDFNRADKFFLFFIPRGL